MKMINHNNSQIDSYLGSNVLCLLSYVYPQLSTSHLHPLPHPGVPFFLEKKGLNMTNKANIKSAKMIIY